jgi:[ribosomal protein S18]-alanine N-acetyltransferase
VGAIRAIERADFEALYRLDQQCFAPGIAYTRSDLRAFLRRAASIALLAESAARELLGFIIVEWAVEGEQRIGHIVTVDVAAEARRQGIGAALMQAAEEQLRRIGVQLVRLEVAVDNFAAQSFYARESYSIVGRIRGYYLGKLDALVLEKVLEKVL